MKPTELRSILQYIPQFRDKIFVLAVDGEIVLDDNFPNILLDVAVLRSLSIKVVLVHGASSAVRHLAERLGEQITSADGMGVTDATTMKITMMAATQLTHEILEGLAMDPAPSGRGAYTTCIEALPEGILKGVDHQFTGRVESVDTELLRALLDKGVVPVIPPLGVDGNGHTYRINSDAVALEVAKALGAVKLIYVTTANGIEVDGNLVRQIQSGELQELLHRSPGRISGTCPTLLSKAEHAARACVEGAGRVHIINGTVDEGLLAEVFSNEGIGTMVYANEYQAIRKAMRKDARRLYSLIRPSMEAEELVKRSRNSIEKQINDFSVFEIDGNIVGCVALHAYPEAHKAELACLAVDAMHERRGIGGKLTTFAENRAREAGFSEIFCLSTQAFTFFEKHGYREGTPDDLPPSRREKYEQSGRKSKVLIRPLTAPASAVPPATTAATAVQNAVAAK